MGDKYLNTEIRGRASQCAKLEAEEDEVVDVVYVRRARVV
jgi:hypothetical protein